MENVRRERVARERGPIDDENLVTLAGKEQRSRRTRATSADDDGVVLIFRHVSPSVGGHPQAGGGSPTAQGVSARC